MISGTILVTGIINELIQLATIPDDVIEDSKFVVESECSLFMDSQTRPTAYNYARAAMLNNLLQSRSSSINIMNLSGKENEEQEVNCRQENSIASLYNEAVEDANLSDLQVGSIDKPRKLPKSGESPSPLCLSDKSYSRESPTNFKDPTYTKLSKSVTFTGPSAHNPDNMTDEMNLSGMIIDPLEYEKGTLGSELITTKHSLGSAKQFPKSISAKLESVPLERPNATTSDNDLWLAFLAETGISTVSETGVSNAPEVVKTADYRYEDPEFIFQQLGYYRRVPSAGRTMRIRDDYEDIHREHPGIFWDTLNMDDPQAAFVKMKKILKNLVETQPNLKPMFDSDFANMDNYPTVKKRLETVYKQIAPQRLFY